MAEIPSGMHYRDNKRAVKAKSKKKILTHVPSFLSRTFPFAFKFHFDVKGTETGFGEKNNYLVSPYCFFISLLPNGGTHFLPKQVQL